MATPKEIREYFARFGKEGGKATAKKRTAAERSDAARKAVEARWAKLNKKLAETKTVIDEGTKKLKKLTQTMERNKKARAKKKSAKGRGVRKFFQS